jgi:hypothetical protein
MGADPTEAPAASALDVSVLDGFGVDGTVEGDGMGAVPTEAPAASAPDNLPLPFFLGFGPPATVSSSWFFAAFCFPILITNMKFHTYDQLQLLHQPFVFALLLSAAIASSGSTSAGWKISSSAAQCIQGFSLNCP